MTGRLLLLLLLGLASGRDEKLHLRPVSLREGLRDSHSSKGDPAKLRKDELYRLARNAGIDLLAKPDHPLVVHGAKDGRVFYLFYKTIENAFGDRPYLIQRIRKTERTWKGDADAEPEVKVTHLVEVFKTYAGQIKRADQHNGYFVLRGARKREIVKEIEIGFGEIPGECEGTAWPFDPGILFKVLQSYQPMSGLYDKVEYTRSIRWSLTVRLDRDGSYEVRAPELGINAPLRLPNSVSAVPRPIEASRPVIVEAGEGVDGLVAGVATRKDVDTVVSEPLQVVEWATRGTDVASPRGYLVNLGDDGTARTIVTLPGFQGATGKGARHGDARERIVALYGLPRHQMTDAAWWWYDGIRFWFDGFDRVRRIEIRARRR